MPFKVRSKEWYIERELRGGKSREETMRALIPQVGVNDPFIYQENVSGRRGRPSYDSKPKPLAEQYRLFIWTVDRTITKMENQGWENSETVSDKRRWHSKESWAVRSRRNFVNQLVREGVIEPPPEFEGEDEEEEFDEKKFYDQDGKEVDLSHVISAQIEVFYYTMMVTRQFVISRENSGQHLDFISTRALVDGCRAIYAGVSVGEVINAITKTWSADSLAEYRRFSTPWKPAAPTVDVSLHPSPMPEAHHYLGYALKLAEVRIPIFLVGPSGSGKSYMARQLSEYLELPYGEIPLTAGVTPAWLSGAMTIKGYVSRPFIQIYKNGGVFVFEELDAADPNILLLVNNALANNYFFNPVTGKEIEKHPDFIPVATANTWGLGATRQYTGRERLDQATLDRWRVGRIEVDYDAGIERRIVDEWKKRADEKQVEGA